MDLPMEEPLMRVEHDEVSMTAADQPAVCYRIRIRDHLDPAWSNWLDGLLIVLDGDGTTMLSGPLVDQAALFGVLARLSELGATLLLVERIADHDPRR
jgi:hypothetical protein